VIGPILFILYTTDLVALIEGVPVTGCRHTSTPTTHRFTSPEHHHTLTCFCQKSPTASPPSLTGCSPTTCNSTITRQSSCGAQPTVANIACPLLVRPSALLVRLQPLRFVTLALTRTCQCVVTYERTFCHSSPATLHPVSSPNHRVPVTGYRACSVSLRLL